jgi:hypothetical protein
MGYGGVDGVEGNSVAMARTKRTRMVRMGKDDYGVSRCYRLGGGRNG